MTNEPLLERSSDGARAQNHTAVRDQRETQSKAEFFHPVGESSAHPIPELSQRPASSEASMSMRYLQFMHSLNSCFPNGKCEPQGIEFHKNSPSLGTATMERPPGHWRNPFIDLQWPGDKTSTRSERREIAVEGAMINVPKDIDPSKPIHFVNYFNGWRSSHVDGYKSANIADAATNAPPNTVFISPRWQDFEHSENSSHRIYDARGGLSGALRRVFQAVPELGRTRLDPRDTIGLVGYSAGFNAVGQALNDKTISWQVNDIVMLDSPSSAVQKYVLDNLPQFVDGRKRFVSVAGDWRTHDYQQFSRAVAAGVLKLGYNPQTHIARGNAEDCHTGGRQSLIFLYTHTPHSALPGKEYKHTAY